MPSINHIIYIPLILGIGFVVGWKLGAAQVLKQWQRADKKRQREEEEAA